MRFEQSFWASCAVLACTGPSLIQQICYTSAVNRGAKGHFKPLCTRSDPSGVGRDWSLQITQTSTDTEKHPQGHQWHFHTWIQVLRTPQFTGGNTRWILELLSLYEDKLLLHWSKAYTYTEDVERPFDSQST